MLALRKNRVPAADGRFFQAGRNGRNDGQGQAKNTSTSGIKKSAAPKRVLVIEDNLDSVHTLALLLVDMGHIVEYAINGYVGLEVARRFRPDFVLLDLGLPGLTGFEVCARIKKDPGLERTRVIAITSFSQDEHRARSKAAGCEMHLVKPVSAEVLEDLLG